MNKHFHHVSSFKFLPIFKNNVVHTFSFPLSGGLSPDKGKYREISFPKSNHLSPGWK